MPNRMQEYYQSQADVLKKALNVGDDALQAYCLEERNIDRLCLVGSGSSFYCGQMTASFLRRVTGCEVLVMVPGQAEKFFPQETDLILLITQEGKSINVMRVAEHLDAYRVKYAVLTALLDSPTAKGASHRLCMGCGEELSGPKTKGVLATLLMLYRFGIEFSKAHGVLSPQAIAQEKEALETSVEQLECAIKSSQRWVEENATFFMQTDFCAILSVAPLCYLGNEGALKLMETLYLPTVSFEFEEFIHGPHCLMGEGFHMIALYHGLPEEERLRALCEFAREKGCRVLEISDQEEENFAGLQLPFSRLECPFSFLLPFQAASAYLSERVGHDLNKPKFAGFATRMKSKLY